MVESTDTSACLILALQENFVLCFYWSKQISWGIRGDLVANRPDHEWA